MIVVCNASPLAALSFIHRLDLLHRLYDTILVPEAVWQEVAVTGAHYPGRKAVLEAEWIERRSVQNHPLVVALLQNLDPGEAEAIALSVEINADLLIIDERLGRRTAQRFGLNFVGVLGVLIEAKHHGVIPEIKTLLDQLRDIAGFRVSDTLYRRVLIDQHELE